VKVLAPPKLEEAISTSTPTLLHHLRRHKSARAKLSPTKSKSKARMKRMKMKPRLRRMS
jgi:hypothetical protein